MVTADDEHIRLESEEAWDKPIHLFYRLNLTVKISLLSTSVSFFNMQIEEIKITPMVLKGYKLIVQGLTSNIQYLHPDQPGNSTVHPIQSNRGSVKTIFILETWYSW